jgi:hypothetical protein
VLFSNPCTKTYKTFQSQKTKTKKIGSRTHWEGFFEIFLTRLTNISAYFSGRFVTVVVVVVVVSFATTRREKGDVLERVPSDNAGWILRPGDD